ncbi:lecithin retinol acyltransferase family protein [Altericista sp. CCNU0014]|uniref:lecithin retinol acyltransferase family protein n=1 Tax=Altericista sp. CCNU0014 TaxID=3082949 RepID=UPI00384BD80E
MTLGDHIYVYRTGYTHHGIDCGDRSVIHYSGSIKEKSQATICQTTLEDFRGGRTLFTKKYQRCDSPEIVVERAKSRTGEEKYDLLFNNCEHFSRWCKTGNHQSEQIQKTLFSGVISKTISVLLLNEVISSLYEIKFQLDGVLKQLSSIKAQLDRIEFKIDLMQESKFRAATRRLLDAIDISDERLVLDCIRVFSEMHEYYTGLLKHLSKGRFSRENLFLARKVFVDIFSLALISNLLESASYLLIGYQNKSIDVFMRNEVFEITAHSIYERTIGGGYICHPSFNLGNYSRKAFCEYHCFHYPALISKNCVSSRLFPSKSSKKTQKNECEEELLYNFSLDYSIIVGIEEIFAIAQI